jgi:prepilin peptidase CpaA
MNLSIQVALILLVTAAAWTDLRSRRVPNWLTVPGAALGFILQAWYGGLDGVLASVEGAAFGMGILMVVYIAGGIGAGDVKLFSAVGALVGPQSLIPIFVCTALLGGVAAAVLALKRGRGRETLGRIRDLLMSFVSLRLPEVRKAGIATDALRLPYAAVIAGGALLALLTFH